MTGRHGWPVAKLRVGRQNAFFTFFSVFHDPGVAGFPEDRLAVARGLPPAASGTV
jgi:hypothetical protein